MPKKPAPARNLKDAAVLYALELEADEVAGPDYRDRVRAAWDRLRKAAIRYREADRPNGRPRNA